MITPVMPTYARADLAFERGEGSWLVTADGRRFLDFACGVAVTSLGHCHPKLVAALTEQAHKVWHTSNLFRVTGQEKLADKLIAHSFAETVFFCNSGAEALEGTIKVVRKHFAAKGQPEKYRIITFEGAFHGRTLATLAAAGNQKYLEGFGPVHGGFDNLPYGDLALVKKTIGPETAGILVEPIQGEGGIRVVSDEFMRGLRALCDEHGLLLALDEVQTGMGRTGKLFGHEWTGVKPDVMALAKALGGGFPVGAVMATADAAAGMMAGTHGSTFGGNPLAMAVANAAFDIIADPAFLDEVNQRANFMHQQLGMIVDNYGDIIEEVRGRGLHIGLKCKVLNTDFGAALRDQEMLSVGAGDNVVRILPPLTVSNAELADGVRRIEAACKAMRAKSGAAAPAKA